MADPSVPPGAGLAGQAALVAELLKRLAHPQRLMIACLLAEAPRAVSEIEAALGIHQPALSQHLAALREAGVIAGTRSAKAVTYRLSDARAGALLAALTGIFCADGRADQPRAEAGAEKPATGSPPAATAAAAPAARRAGPRHAALAGAAHFARIGAAVAP
ncbi:MAG: winged helix-turn-helix transcriptional regulator [Rhodospirillales bacterium]|nr:winged helix-turn-helix transcriptional regulator [Rhodospirillales bacterium]